MIADAFATRTAQVDAAAQDRARTLLFALSAADQTYDRLGEHLKRALGYERRPMFREPKRVRAELEIAARKLAVLTRQVETAMASLEG